MHLRTSGSNGSSPKRFVVFCVLLGFAGAVLLAGGCSHSREEEFHGGAFNRIFAPQPPSFLNGPMGLLLTNATGFSAQLQVENEPLGGLQLVQSGQFLGRGNMLLFAPTPDKKTEKTARAGGFSFLWDVANHRGFVLSEALQGYTPVESNLRATNLVTGTISAPPQTVAGHSCQPADATVQMDDGTSAIFRLLRATDLNGFPVRLSSATNPIPLILTFSKIRLEAPPADVFAVPEGFTKYNTPEAMADELVMRQHNLKRKVKEEPEPFDRTAPEAPRRY